MCYVDLEPCEVWRETDRKARKSHACSACRGPIRPGETYTVHFSVYEGSATSEKICAGCHADRAAFASAHEGLLCQPSALRGMVSECLGDLDDGDDGESWRAMLARIAARRSAP